MLSVCFVIQKIGKLTEKIARTGKMITIQESEIVKCKGKQRSTCQS
jgi:hypothetical protein